MPKQHPKMSKNEPNMAPKWAQVGDMLGSKIVLDVSKGEKNASQRPLEKRFRKGTKKLGLEGPQVGSTRGGGGAVVFEPLLAPTTVF